MSPAQLAWGSQEDAIVIQLWAVEGKSAQACANELPGRTRNAVIGRCNRLGLQRHGYNKPTPAPRPDACTWPPKKPRAAPRKAQDRLERLPAIIQPEQPQAGPCGPVPFIRAKGCRWPRWDSDALPSQKFVCGANRKHGDPYCREHMAVAYQPMKVRA